MDIGEQHSQADNVVQTLKGDRYIPIGFQDTGKASAPMSSGAYMDIGEQRNQADNAITPSRS